MRRFLSVVLACMFLFLTSCGDGTYYKNNVESTIVEDEVVVTDIEKYHRWAVTHRWQVELTVKSDEYGIEETISYYNTGAWGAPDAWFFEEGDTLKAQIQIETDTDTGEILKAHVLRVLKS